MGYAEKILQPGETIAYRARLHWIIYLAGMLLVLVAIGLAVAAVALKTEAVRIGLLLGAVIALFLGLFQMIRAWLVAANTEIIVTSRRVIYKTGFISRNTVEMNLDKVESVLVQQSLIGRMLDYGSVIVRGVGAGLEPIDNIAAPLQLHRHIGTPNESNSPAA
ncbi:MAG TPA: PH domain-containing protein [Caulobacteraceae bacterium]|nr:PH domain-containing protein [Caulobacteraceae bacterium]